MNDELIEQVARAIHAAHMIEKGPLAAWTWEEAAKSYYEGFALAAIAAMQPHIAAEREDAARRALEAAIIATASERLQDETGDATDISYQCAVEHCSDAIRVIDPAQFREAGNG